MWVSLLVISTLSCIWTEGLCNQCNPSALTLHVVDNTFIQAEWSPQTDALGYQILYNTSANAGWLGEMVVNATVLSVNITALVIQAHVEYCVSVSPFKEGGEGPPIVHCLLVSSGGGCLTGWSHFEGHCYVYVKTKRYRFNAQQDCLNRNAYLVDVTSESENTFVLAGVNQTSWIGLKSDGKTFRWTNHTAVGQYEYWHEGIPGKPERQTCVIMSLNGTWQNTSCFNKHHYTCKRAVFKDFPCVDRDLGMERGFISHDQITPKGSSPRLGLSSFSSWCQKDDELDGYLQVDLVRLHEICAIATQGHHGDWKFVTQYNLAFSQDGFTWEWYKDDHNQKEIFKGNYRPRKVKKITLREGFQATVVRFKPVSWEERPCMRIELYGRVLYQVPPYSPANITVHSINSTALKVMWHGVPANGPIDAYEVTATLIGDNSGHGKQTKGDENHTVFTHLEIFSTYRVCVSPRNSVGLGAAGCVNASTDEGVLNTLPSDVTVTLSVNESSVLIDWNPVHAVLGYRVQYLYVTSAPSNSSTIVTSCTCVQLRDLKPRKLYFACVSAFTKAGLRKEGACVFTDTHRVKKSGSRDRNNSQTTTTASTTTVKPLSTDKPQGTTHPTSKSITILSTDKTQSISSTARPTSESVPEKFHTNVTVRSISPTSLLVSWDSVSSDRVNGVLLGYRVLYKKAGLPKARKRREVTPTEKTTVLTFNATVRSAVLTGLQEFTSYCVRVLAFTQKGDGEPNECIIGETAEEAPPVAPQPVTGSMIDPTFAQITWGEVPEDAVKGQLLGYVVFFGNNKTLVNSSVQTLVLKDIQLKPDTCVQVAAFNRAGYGRRSNCTYVIEAQLPAPNAVTASMKKSPSEVEVTWEKLPEGKRLGVLGYKVRFYAVKENGKSAKNTSSQTVEVKNTNATVLRNLRPFTTYATQVAAYIKGKDGNYSDAVNGATCNCDKDFSEAVNSSSTYKATNSSHFGGLASIISNLVTDSCGSCGDYGETTVRSSDTSEASALEYPVSRASSGKTDEYSTFIPVILVPGVIIITRRTESPHALNRVATNSILEAWPLFLLTILTALLAGIIIWALDRTENPGHFPHQFVKGAGEGLWWAVITMTTLGYGDRVPKSVLAKAFAIIWFLVGLVIFALFMGTLSAALTVTVVRENLNSYRGTTNTKVAVVEGSVEHSVSLQSLSSKVAIGDTYPSLTELVEALKSGKVDAALVDMYVPIKRRDLFNGTWFEVNRLLKVNIAHGVLLKGEAKRLEHEIRNLLVKENVQINYLKPKDSPEKKGVPAPVQENSILVLAPGSPFFQKTLLVSGVALGAAFFCGLLYQLKLTISRKRTVQDSTALIALQKKKDLQEMLELVTEFYTSFRENFTTIRKQHLAQLRSVAIMRKNAWQLK